VGIGTTLFHTYEKKIRQVDNQTRIRICEYKLTSKFVLYKVFTRGHMNKMCSLPFLSGGKLKCSKVIGQVAGRIACVWPAVHVSPLVGDLLGPS
jgi:hypothetical protein